MEGFVCGWRCGEDGLEMGLSSFWDYLALHFVDLEMGIIRYSTETRLMAFTYRF